MMIIFKSFCDFSMVLSLNKQPLQFLTTSSRFITHFFAPLDFLCSLSSSIKYAHVSPTNSYIIFPPNSFLKRSITFLFLPIGNGLLSLSPKLDVLKKKLTSLAMFL